MLFTFAEMKDMVLLEFRFQYVEVAVMLLYFVVIGLLLFEFRGMKELIKERLDLNKDGMKLQLQALERLTLFSERAGLRNLLSRIESMDMSASHLHTILVAMLKAEYEYNITQQIYVNPEIWHAVSRLKDQNIYIINQLAAGLPSEAIGMDLGKRLLEYCITKDAELNTVVLDALQYEAKKILSQTGQS